MFWTYQYFKGGESKFTTLQIDLVWQWHAMERIALLVQSTHTMRGNVTHKLRVSAVINFDWVEIQ